MINFISDLLYIWLWQVIQSLAVMIPLGVVYIMMLTAKKVRELYGKAKTR